MSKRNIFIMMFALLAIAMLTVSVSADQVGNDRWCNVDQYGCWVTAEDGGKCYIMFWSEEARAYFMGGISKPGELVTDMPNTSDGRMGLERVVKKSWKDYLIEMIYRHRAYLEGQGVNISKLIKDNIAGFEKNLADGELTEAGIIELIKDWDDGYKQSEQ